MRTRWQVCETMCHAANATYGARGIIGKKANARAQAILSGPAENATGATEDQISRSEGEEEAEEGEDATSKIHLG